MTFVPHSEISFPGSGRNKTDDILFASAQRSLQELLMGPDEATAFFHKKMILFPFATRADLIAGVRLAVENYFNIRLEKYSG